MNRTVFATHEAAQYLGITTKALLDLTDQLNVKPLAEVGINKYWGWTDLKDLKFKLNNTLTSTTKKWAKNTEICLGTRDIAQFLGIQEKSLLLRVKKEKFPPPDYIQKSGLFNTNKYYWYKSSIQHLMEGYTWY